MKLYLGTFLQLYVNNFVGTDKDLFIYKSICTEILLLKDVT